MEPRKIKEIEHYDKQSAKTAGGRASGDFEGFEPRILASFRYLYKLAEKYCPNKIILDFGCGNGIHSVFLAKTGAKKVIGIDLSEKSLQLAKERAEREGMIDKIEFLKRDCERTEFPNDYFDLIFDGGTFSSLDLNSAFPEMARILKPAGFLIGIETFGHNPFTNLKRKINKLTGKRTDWASAHLLKMKDLEMTEKYFDKIEVHYFHLVSWLAFPFLNFFAGKAFLIFLEKTDKLLLLIFPFLKKYCFKAVFIAEKRR